MTIHILPLTRAIDPLVAQTHSLFLAQRAVELGQDNRTLRETLERLCASSNAAIASEALRLMAPLRMLK